MNVIGHSHCEVISVEHARDAYRMFIPASDANNYCGITPFQGTVTYYHLRLGLGLSVLPTISHESLLRSSKLS